MTGGKGIDQFVGQSDQPSTITDFGTNSQTDTFNLTSASNTVGITVLSDFTASSSHVNNSGGVVTLTTSGAGVDLNLSASAGTKGFTVATGSADGGVKNAIVGSKFDDSITATAAGSTITGGKGADALTGAAGIDTFNQTAGDTTAATATNLAADTLTAGFTLTFNSGVDILTTFVSGTDKINLSAAAATTLAAGDAINALTIGANHIIRGAIASVGNVDTFTQADAGADYMLFTAAGTTLNAQASAFGTNVIIGDGSAIVSADVI
jgi:hypothetical protein